MWTAAALAVVVLGAAVPYVARVRHPDQQPFAAYLVFVTVFSLTAVILFVIIAWLGQALGVMQALGQWGLTVLLLLLGVAPALTLATWQARKPPMRRDG